MLNPYVDNDEFRNLIDLGPVAIPWLIKEGGVIEYTGMDMLLCNWQEMAGIRIVRGYPINTANERVGLLTSFEAWWNNESKSMPNIANIRMTALKKVVQARPKTAELSEILVTQEWKMIRDAGLFAIPNTINRAKNGQGDELDFRLLVYWTESTKHDRRGVLIKKPENENMPEEKKRSDYWVKWWQNNAWQYWWLPGVNGN
jgi:hypothetical protein